MESFEDELTPILMKQKDSEFERELNLSFDVETTQTEREDIIEQFASKESAIQNQIEKLTYYWTNHRMWHAIQTLEFTSLLVSQLSLPYSTGSLLPSFYSVALTLVDAMLRAESLRSRSIYQAPKKPKKEDIFGVSLTGITIKEDKIKIDPKELEQGVFYLFSHKDEKYVARKIDENIIKIYEVLD